MSDAMALTPPQDLDTTKPEMLEADALDWLEQTLPRAMRRLMDSDDLDMPLLQLPLAQMRLAQALYNETEFPGIRTEGETMGRLSERLGVRQNALTQAADRLINHELAERLSDINDRRIVRLRLSEKGREWVSARRARRRARLSDLWGVLNSAERREFLQSVSVLEALGNRLKNLSPSGENDAQTVEETLSRFTA